MYDDLYENKDAKNSIEYNNIEYFNVLNSKINEIKNLKEVLINKIRLNQGKQDKFISFLQVKNFTILGAISLVSILTSLTFNLNTLNILPPSMGGYIIFTIINLNKYEWKDKALKTKMNTLENIRNYLDTEQEITKDMKYLLKPNTISHIEDFIEKDIKTINEFKGYKYLNLQLINNKYETEYQRNLTIIAAINNLEYEQKQRYLENIYGSVDNNEIHFDDIMINISNKKRETMSNLLVLPTKNKTSADNITESLDNIPLEHISTKLSINKDDEQQVNINYSNTSESSSESINATAPNPNKPVKPVSLKKEDYGLPYYDENGVLCINGDPMPPMFQKEKGHQFSKKFPN